MKKKKGLLIAGLSAVLLLIMIFGGLEIYKYNTMLYRVVIGGTTDGKIAQPAMTWYPNSKFGASEKAQKKSQEIVQEWDEKVWGLYIDLGMSYTDRTLDVTVRAVDGKTEIHVFGEGIPKGESEKRKIDEIVWLNYAFEPGKDVVY